MNSRLDKNGPGAAERRTGVRVEAEGGRAAVLEIGGRGYRCEIEDVSLRGARIRIYDVLPEEEEAIVLEHPSTGRLPGRCVWREKEQLGIELDLPERDLERALQCIALAIGEAA